MKNYLKLMVITAAVITSFTTISSAQTTTTSTTSTGKSGPNIGFGLNLGVPQNGGSRLALGGDLRFQFDLTRNLSLPLTTGYTHIFNDDGSPDGGYIPAKAGLKYFFNDATGGWYGLAEAGAAFTTTKGSGSGGGTSFVYSPAIGYAWGNGYDVGVKYEGLAERSSLGTKNYGYIGVRLAYAFVLK